MIEIVEGLPRNVVGFAVSGRLTMDDCREVLVPAVKKSLKESVEFHCSSWQGTGNAYYTIIALI